MVDVITIEIEHVNAEVLEDLESHGHVVHPSAKTIRIIQVSTKNETIEIPS